MTAALPRVRRRCLHIVWKTDATKIRPEIAAMQEPFGNAVHAASKVDVKGKTVAIFGLGPIGDIFVFGFARAGRGYYHRSRT